MDTAPQPLTLAQRAATLQQHAASMLTNPLLPAATRGALAALVGTVAAIAHEVEDLKARLAAHRES